MIDFCQIFVDGATTKISRFVNPTPNKVIPAICLIVKDYVAGLDEPVDPDFLTTHLVSFLTKNHYDNNTGDFRFGSHLIGTFDGNIECWDSLFSYFYLVKEKNIEVRRCRMKCPISETEFVNRFDFDQNEILDSNALRSLDALPFD